MERSDEGIVRGKNRNVIQSGKFKVYNGHVSAVLDDCIPQLAQVKEELTVGDLCPSRNQLKILAEIAKQPIFLWVAPCLEGSSTTRKNMLPVRYLNPG